MQDQGSLVCIGIDYLLMLPNFITAKINRKLLTRKKSFSPGSAW